MKRIVLSILKEKNQLEYFSEEKYRIVVDTMKHGMKKDKWLNNYLSLDPLNKAQWISDHLVSLSEQNLI